MSASPPSWNPFVRWPWLWCAVAFAIMLAAWTILFIIAAKHPTPDVAGQKIPVAPATR